jgi:hypothetical protein
LRMAVFLRPSFLVATAPTPEQMARVKTVLLFLTAETSEIP